MTQFGWSNCSEDVRAQVAALLEGLKGTLAGNLAAVTLHGSLAMNCFNPRRSDIDLLAVCDSALSLPQQRQLALLMLKGSRKPYPIEISILVKGAFEPWKYPTPFEFHYSEQWRLAFNQSILEGGTPWNRGEERDYDLAAHIAVARRRGVSLLGPDPADIYPVIPEEDYLDSIFRDVNDALYGLSLKTSQPVYAILNTCRVYAYLRTGQIYSKAEGGEWALHGLPARYHPLILQAQKYYRGDSEDHNFSSESLQEFISFMKTDFEKFVSLSGGQ